MHNIHHIIYRNVYAIEYYGVFQIYRNSGLHTNKIEQIDTELDISIGELKFDSILLQTKYIYEYNTTTN